MIILELHEVEIDYCTQCNGIWLDEGELELLCASGENANQFLRELKSAKKTAEASRKCPICRKKMAKVLFGENGDIMVDKCTKNHGIWFDDGELIQTVELLSKESNQSGAIAALLKDMFTN